MGLMDWWCSGLFFPLHAHQVVVTDIYFAISKGTFPPRADVDPPHYVVDSQYLFVLVPPFVLEGLGS